MWLDKIIHLWVRKKKKSNIELPLLQCESLSFRFISSRGKFGKVGKESFGWCTLHCVLLKQTEMFNFLLKAKWEQKQNQSSSPEVWILTNNRRQMKESSSSAVLH